jgi:hypothetical protein
LAVGLEPNHGKTLHIVAHSMGGLVSRWFIEREGGNGMVQHLIMLGTPNAGSPWSTVEDLAIPLLTIGLNSLSVAVWPAKVLGSLLAALETIDVSLDQMKPNSDFLKSLAASDAPGIPYSIVAGNTSIIQPKSEEQANKLKALLNKVSKAATEFPFLGYPNDIAVLVNSIKSVPEGRMPQPVIQEVACNHLVYFANAVGLRGLSDAVNRAFAKGQDLPPSVPPTITPLTVTPQPETDQPAPDSPTSHQNGHRWWIAGLGVLAIAIFALVVLWPKRSQIPQPQPQSHSQLPLWSRWVDRA